MNVISPARWGRNLWPTMHYIALLMPAENESWRFVVPDLNECEARGTTVRDAAAALSDKVAQQVAGGRSAPLPRNLVQIESDNDWLAAHRIDIAEAVVMMIPVWQNPDRGSA